MKLLSSLWALAASMTLCATGCTRAERATELTLPGKELFPESITSLKDGTLIIGSSGQGSILRVAPGSNTAEEWIAPGTGGLDLVLGVLADEESNTLWVCSNNLHGQGRSPTAAKTFDLKTGTPQSSYDIPGPMAFCNDVAVGADGTAYIADTRQNSVFLLKKGASAVELAAEDEKLAGADGLAFGTQDRLYVNSVTTGKLLRLDLGPDGKATSVTELTLSKPLERPDGMRTIDSGRLIVAENAGRIDILTLSEGDNVTVTTIKDGLEATPAVTIAQGLAWTIEGKLNYRNDPNLKGKDPSPFKAYSVPLP